ncbi:hypothetical protein F4604DRAFT_2032066 [Suillus subluteus]|nr:hypothetical protein F4604DRAFT_2032066 [Suillus subluteus]
MAKIHNQFNTILILDFSSQYSHLITRRCCELNVYAELMPCTSKLANLKFKLKGIILSGSPYSVYDNDHHTRIPISRTTESGNSVDALFEGLSDQMQVWCVFLDNGEVITVLCEEFIGKEIICIHEICGPKGHVISAVSGGVDSTVAANDRFPAIMVVKGVLHLKEAQQVNNMLNKDLGVNLNVVDASELFLSRLDGVEDLEKKCKIIRNTFINIFMTEAAKIEEAAKEENGVQAKGKIKWLLQGTLYPDGPSATIKTHHNVSGLLKDMELKLIEPLHELFRDEVHALGRLLSIPAPLVQHHPFPGPGLAIQILGPVTREQVKIPQQVDHIYIKEIRKANLYNQISQAMAILLPVNAAGVKGDKRTYEQVCGTIFSLLRCLSTFHRYVFPPEVLHWISSHITNEVNGINRVTYDISSKPPATMEWL